MDFTLVVVQPFGPHASGDAITDPDSVATVLEGEHADKVVRVARPAAPPAQTGSAPVAQPAKDPAAPAANEPAAPAAKNEEH